MKKFSFVLAMLAVVLVLGLAFVSCDNDTTTSNSGGGAASTLTLIDIPAAYNGKYIAFGGWILPSTQLFGCENLSLTMNSGIQNASYTLTRINNGRATIPMWRILSATPQAATFTRFTGEGRSTELDGGNTFAIYNSAVFTNSFDTTNPQAIPNQNQQMIAQIRIPSITFANGSATVSVNDGTLYGQ